MIKRFLLLAAAAGLALTGLVSIAPSASAAGCNAQNGTIVVVDFSHWGLPQRTQCVLGTADGLSLLREAGFPPTPASADPSFICRISNGAQSYPTQDQDPCIHASPASAYWSYWVAGPSDPNCLPGGTPQTWTYSGCGASSYTPSGPGEVQLWVFGPYNASSHMPGGRSPDSIRALYPAPAGGGGSTSSRGAPVGAAVAPRNVGKASPSATTSPIAKPSASASASSPASSSASAAAVGVVAAEATDIVKGAATPTKKSGDSGPTGALVALGVVVVLGVGGWFARRRFARRAAG